MKCLLLREKYLFYFKLFGSLVEITKNSVLVGKILVSMPYEVKLIFRH